MQYKTDTIIIVIVKLTHFKFNKISSRNYALRYLEGHETRTIMISAALDTLTMRLFLTPYTGGAPPTDVTVEQTGVSTVLVMWTAPSPPPTDGYQVQITRGSTTTTVNVAGTSYTASSLQHSVYSFRVKSLSRHFLSEATEPIELRVRGKWP